ncbi:long-chain-fatty-acid--CoA ligase [Streptosporangium amethystogenes]|uniref:long-chain-fatty-acid--CoA ligase n=1 Tax=Streptosporangium amethystogenes TaxID=2002 RepID=UPI0037A05573
MSEETLAGLLARRADDDRPGLLFEERTWSWREYVAECRARAALLDARGRNLHVGVLFDNVPEVLFLLGGAALSGHVIVALNTTRSAAELARDADATHVDLLLHEPGHATLAADLTALRDPGAARFRPSADSAAPSPAPFADPVREDALTMLIFTSGTSGRPRAVKITQRKIAVPGTSLAAMLSPQDVVYCSMPLFHSGAIMAAYAPAVASGAALVLRRRFSASGLMPDVRRYGVTYLHYVGKALSYVLATPAEPSDAENTLKIAFGNEGSATAVSRFGERFGCYVIDAFGSTETAISITPAPSGPPGCLGRLPEEVEIRDPATGERCPVAVFEDGRLLNAGEAIGELVNTRGLGLFDGYYNDPDADRERVRQGAFWSGDLAYADADGYVFFAGRGTERLRVDGENLAVAPIEAVVREFPGVVEAAVYPVPDAAAGDQVMAALVLRDGFDPEAFASFLAGRKDVGPKAIPRYIRISAELPQTASNKVIKRILAAEAWHTGDPVWWRPPGQASWRPLTSEDARGIDDEFIQHGRRQPWSASGFQS